MQALPFLAMIASALAAQSFDALIIRSGSKYQYSSFKASGDDLTASSGNDVKLVLNDDTTLVDTITQKYITVASDKAVVLSDTAQVGFSFKNGYLAYNNSSAFDVCSDSKINFNSNAEGCLGVAVSVRNPANIDNASETTTSTTSTIIPLKREESELTKTPESSSTESSATATPSAPAEPAENIQKFGLIAIHSGSSVQNAGIKKVAEHAHVFSVGGSEGEFLTLTLDPESTTLVDQDGKGIALDQNTGEFGDVPPTGRQPATSGFSIENGHLLLNGNSGWKACPSGGDRFSLTNKDCDGGIDIALRVINV